MSKTEKSEEQRKTGGVRSPAGKGEIPVLCRRTKALYNIPCSDDIRRPQEACKEGRIRESGAPGSEDNRGITVKIYIDFDDCLCETADSFCSLAAKRFGSTVTYEELKDFDLQKSFSLTKEQYEQMMAEGHTPEVLLSLEETPGASETVNGWIDEGHEVFIITGRPYPSYEASRLWLDRHGLDRVKLFCLDKYGRSAGLEKGEYFLTVEEFGRMDLDVAIEDSPAAFRFFEPFPKLQVMVFDRPWNRGCELPGENYHRCRDWKMIRNMVKERA